MKISDITINSYRKYSEAKYYFDSNFTIMIGDNASGKSTILDAISILLSSYILDFGIRSAKHIKPSDVRLKTFKEQELVNVEPQYPVTLEANISIHDQQKHVKRELVKKGGKTTRIGAKSLIDAGNKDLEKIKNNTPVNLPIMSYYGTGRLWHMKRHTDFLEPESKVAAYNNCLDPNSDHLEFQKWFKTQEAVALQKRIEIPPLEAVRKAVITSIPDCKNFYYDLQANQIVLEFGNEEYSPFDNLSDGYKNIVAMIADIAHRSARLNPHFGLDIAQKTTGIILIDEIDLHLHPKWQRHIVNDLQNTFPSIQFIATTHSPFIVQSVEAKNIIDLNQEPALNALSNNPAGLKVENENNSLEDITEAVMGVAVPQRSYRYQQMYESAKEYYSVLQSVKEANAEYKEELKQKLDTLVAPFSDNPAYHAFLEMERLAVGLGKSENKKAKK